MKKSLIAAAVSSALLPISSIAQDANEDEHHQLDEIVVTALPLGRTVEALTQSTSVISGDALDRTQDQSIGELVDGQLGVSASYFGPISSRPVIRGQFGERVLVLSNGLDTLDASALSEDHAVALDSLIANRVEIVRGPATLLYGSSAAGGIVNVVDSRLHEETLDSPIQGAASVNTDSALDATSTALKLDLSAGQTIFHFDYLDRETENVEIPGFAESDILRTLEGELDGQPEEQIENTDSETETLSAGLSIIGDDGDFFGFSVTNYDSNYGIPGEHGHEEEEGGAEEEEEEEIIRIDMEQIRYDVRGQLGLDAGPFEAVRFAAAFNDYEHVELEGEEIGTVYSNDSMDLRVDLLQRASDSLAGTVGLQYKAVDLNAIGEEAFVPASDTEQFSIYAFQEWVASDVLILQGSARWETQEITTADFDNYDESSFGASIGAIYNINETLTLNSNLAITERHPNATELFADGPHLAVSRIERGSVALGNGELDKELSVNVDVTLRGDLDRLAWSVTVFNNDISDFIFLSPTGLIDEDEELPIFDFRQADAEFYGVEAEVLFDIIDTGDRHLHTRVFTDFVHAEESSGAYLPRITPLRYGASLHFVEGSLDASLGVSFNDSQDKTATNELHTDSWTDIEAEVSYRFDNPNVLVFLKGTNLGDEDQRRHTSPLKDIAPLPGRAIRAGIRWDF